MEPLVSLRVPVSPANAPVPPRRISSVPLTCSDRLSTTATPELDPYKNPNFCEEDLTYDMDMPTSGEDLFYLLNGFGEMLTGMGVVPPSADDPINGDVADAPLTECLATLTAHGLLEGKTMDDRGNGKEKETETDQEKKAVEEISRRRRSTRGGS